MPLPTQLDIMLASYVETALWSSYDQTTDQGGEPLDRNYGREDIAPESLTRMRIDCAAFLAVHARDIELSDQTPAQVGHDFWLTRNGHGAGFWDGDYPEPQGAQLTAAAHAFGESDLYVGDDGKVYAS